MTVRVYEQQPLARMRLLAEVLSTLEVHGKLATITITNAMVAKTGTEIDFTTASSTTPGAWTASRWPPVSGSRRTAGPGG